MKYHEIVCRDKSEISRIKSTCRRRSRLFENKVAISCRLWARNLEINVKDDDKEAPSIEDMQFLSTMGRGVDEVSAGWLPCPSELDGHGCLTHAHIQAPQAHTGSARARTQAPNAHTQAQHAHTGSTHAHTQAQHAQTQAPRASGHRLDTREHTGSTFVLTQIPHAHTKAPHVRRHGLDMRKVDISTLISSFKKSCLFFLIHLRSLYCVW